MYLSFFFNITDNRNNERNIIILFYSELNKETIKLVFDFVILFLNIVLRLYSGNSFIENL